MTPTATRASDASRRGTDALPVDLRLEGPQAGPIRQWVEGIAGWQAVDGATAALVPPALTVVDSAAAPGEVTTPVLLLTTADDPPATAARAAGRWRPDAVAAWPDERDRLPEVAADLVAHADPDVTPVAELRVGGAAGGVGTTTVALALGGLAAWRGRRTLVVSHGAVPSPCGGPLAPDDLAGTQTWATASVARGVPGLRVVRAAAPVDREVVAAGAAELVVRDVGVHDDVDVLVVRRDRAGIDALGRTVAAAVVVTDVGAASPASLRSAAGARRLVVLPWSARVARAGLAGRVPAGLPGSWLRALAPVLRAGSG